MNSRAPHSCGTGESNIVGCGVPSNCRSACAPLGEFSMHVGCWVSSGLGPVPRGSLNCRRRSSSLSNLRKDALELIETAQTQPQMIPDAAHSAVVFAWEVVLSGCRGILPAECWPLNDPNVVTMPGLEQASRPRRQFEGSTKESSSSSASSILSISDLVPAIVVDVGIITQFAQRFRSIGSELAIHRSLDLSGDVHHMSKLALQNIQMYNGEPVAYIQAYIDGSRTETNSGWGACILVSLIGGDKKFFGCMRGEASKSRSDNGEVGGFTNNSAELTSAIQILCWCISIDSWFESNSIESLIEIEVCYDNVLVEMAGNGVADFKVNRQIASLASLLASICRQRFALRFRHIKGHSGNPWNELADRLANHAISDIPSNAWLLDDVIDDPVSLHQVTAIHSVLSGHQMWHPQCVNDKLFITEADRPHLSAEASFNVSGFVGRGRSGGVGISSAGISFGTMNVLSLDPEEIRSKRSSGLVETGRMQLLQRSLADVGVQFCGVQEARTRGPEVREMEKYVAVSSGATPEGSHGCEFWAATGVPLYINGAQFFVTSQCLSVFLAEPTILIVAVAVGGLRFDAVVAHGPPSDDPVRVGLWWARFTSIVRGRPAPQAPVVLMLDANAKVGSETSLCVGSYRADQETLAGSYLRSLVEEIDCFLLRRLNSMPRQACPVRGIPSSAKDTVSILLVSHAGGTLNLAQRDLSHTSTFLVVPSTILSLLSDALLVPCVAAFCVGGA